MKIIIDEKLCTKHKMTVPEVLLALAVRSQDSDNVLEDLVEKEVLVRPNDNAPLYTYLVTQRWSDVIDEILADSSGSVEKTDEEILELAKKMRDLYPQGKMIDRYGQPTPYYFRCNNSEVVKKLKTFFARYGNYSNEEILNATRRYVNSFGDNYQQRGFRLLKYFIFKDDVKPGPDGQGHVESLSPLLDFLENKEESEGESNNSDWTTKLI